MAVRYVPPDGPRDARVVAVGRDPGQRETLTGKPFCGPAGDLFNEWLEESTMVRRRDVLVLNVVPVQPAGNKWEAHLEGEVEKGVEELHVVLGAHPRELIIALGEQALHACLGYHPDEGKYEITEARGYVFEGPFGPVLATLHPAFVLRQWHPNYELGRRDFDKARRYLGGEHRAALGHESRWTTEVSEGRAAAARAVGARGRVTVDIETRSDGTIACVGFASDAKLGFCVPYLGRFVEVVDWLLQEAPELCFHNGQFDVTVLRRNGHKVRAEWDDTMLMWHALKPTLAGQREGRKGKKRTEKSLRFLAGLLTWEPFWKDYEFANEQERWRLCATDARVTWEVAERLSELLAG